MRRAYAFVFSLFFWPYFLTTCALLFFGSLVVWLVTLPFDPNKRLLHRYTLHWARHYLVYAPGADFRLEGQENAPAGPCVYVANHQSMVDILAVFATQLNFKWVSKVENFYAPFIGWTMLLNQYVPLKRGNAASTLRMFRASMRWLRRKQSVCVFPEGTRSPDGALLPFYRGAFLLAVKCGVPVVPIVMDGLREMLPKGTGIVTPGRVTIRILPPIYPSDVSMDSRALRDLVRERMITAREEIRARAV
jgi:1-acyl-sn-glycerol-3-phosphate acyltransferase